MPLLAIDFLYIEYGVASPSPLFGLDLLLLEISHYAFCPLISETNPVHMNVHVYIVYSFMHSRRYVFSPFSV